MPTRNEIQQQIKSIESKPEQLCRQRNESQPLILKQANQIVKHAQFKIKRLRFLCILLIIFLMESIVSIDISVAVSSGDQIQTVIISTTTGNKSGYELLRTKYFPFNREIVGHNATKTQIIGGVVLSNIFLVGMPIIFDLIVLPFQALYNNALRNRFEEPILNTLSSSKSSQGSTVILYGQNLDLNPVVTFDNCIAEIVETKSEELSVRVPANTKLEEVEVVVKTSKGTTESKKFYVKSTKPPLLNIKDIKFTDTNKNNILEALELAKLSFIIDNNKNSGIAYGIKVKMDLDQKLDVKFNKEISIEKILPGESQKVEVDMTGGLSLINTVTKLNIDVTESNGYSPLPATVILSTAKLKKPDLVVNKIGIDDGMYSDPNKLCVGNGNGKIEAGESIEVKLSLFNNGDGNTRNTKLEIKYDGKNIKLLTQNIFELGNIEPNSTKEIYFAFSTFRTYQGANILPIRLKITDNVELFNKEISLDLAIGKEYPKALIVKIDGKGNIEIGKNQKVSTRKINIAVIDFKPKSVSSVDATTVSDLIRSELVKIGIFNVVDRNNMDRILGEQKFQTTDYCTDTECAVQLGNILKVEKMIIGTHGSLGGKYFITVDMVDVGTAKIITSKTESFEKQEDVFKIVPKIASDISFQLE